MLKTVFHRMLQQMSHHEKRKYCCYYYYYFKELAQVCGDFQTYKFLEFLKKNEGAHKFKEKKN